MGFCITAMAKLEISKIVVSNNFSTQVFCEFDTREKLGGSVEREVNKTNGEY